MHILRRSGLLLIAALLASAAFAHHSTANFDRDRKTTISGKVTQFSFANPHSFIKLMVAGTDGKTEEFTVFATSKVVLLRYGWKPTSVKPGDTIKVVGFPDKDEPHYLYMKDIVFGDGSEWSRENILE